MTKHIKHDDNLDVQIRTRILDEYGNPIDGAIEYDPSTGFGKRIKDPALGLVESFFRKGGSVEIDGHNFDDTNQDDAQVDAIKDMITLKVSRNTPEYEDLLKQHINQKRQEDIAKHPPGPHKEPDTPVNLATLNFIATTQIAKGERVKVDPDAGEVRGTRADNVLHQTEEAREQERQNRPKPHGRNA